MKIQGYLQAWNPFEKLFLRVPYFMYRRKVFLKCWLGKGEIPIHCFNDFDKKNYHSLA